MIKNIFCSLLDNLKEIVFLIGLTLVSIGLFQIDTVVGLIATGVMLVGLSFLLGGD